MFVRLQNKRTSAGMRRVTNEETNGVEEMLVGPSAVPVAPEG